MPQKMIASMDTCISIIYIKGRNTYIYIHTHAHIYIIYLSSMHHNILIQYCIFHELVEVEKAELIHDYEIILFKCLLYLYAM